MKRAMVYTGMSAAVALLVGISAGAASAASDGLPLDPAPSPVSDGLQPPTWSGSAAGPVGTPGWDTLSADATGSSY